MEFTLDNQLHVRRADGQDPVEIPPVSMSGFKCRPELIPFVNRLGFREDTNETAVIQRALDYVEAKAVEVMYAELRALKFLPVIDVPLGAASHTFALLDKTGVARRVGNQATDSPRANIQLSEYTHPIGRYTAMYGYTTEDLRRFSYWSGTGRGPALSLDTERAETCQQMIARKIDAVLASGDPDDARILGFVNNSNITPDTTTCAHNWIQTSTTPATYAQMLGELLAFANLPVSVSKEAFVPDMILLPTAHLQAAQAVQNANGTRSVLEAFNEAMESADRKVEVRSWPLLATANTGGTGPRAISYVRKNSVVGALVPALFIAQPPQAVGLEWQIFCEGLCGGAVVKAPLGIAYFDMNAA